MRDDSGAEPAEDDCSEMVIRMVMRQYNPFHWLLCHGADVLEKVLRLTGARQRIDDDDA
jgi:hypothetical protein